MARLLVPLTLGLLLGLLPAVAHACNDPAYHPFDDGHVPNAVIMESFGAAPDFEGTGSVAVAPATSVAFCPEG